MSEECVKVVVRVRPSSDSTSGQHIARSPSQHISNVPAFPLKCEPEENQLIVSTGDPRKTRVFCFDGVFTQSSTQQELFEATASRLVNQVLQGYNGTIFAYGQTGSGKTYTMMGRDNEPGIVPRSFRGILQLAKSSSTKNFLVMCSYMELYNEEIRDLLVMGEKPKLDLRESPEAGVFIKDLKKVSVTTEQEMMKYVCLGNSNRTTGQTLMNAESSRSHSIFTIYVESLETTGDCERLVGSKFNLVDLAGSERQSKTGSIGDRFLQATKINLSLTALGKVISALVEGKNGHVPYRDSKLTRLLQDSLGGNAKTVMIATVSSLGVHLDETVSTLKYASRAKYITNNPIINQDPKDALLREYEDEIKRLRSQLETIHDPVDVDQLKFQKEKIAKQAEKEKKELMNRIQQLQEKFISMPHQLSKKLLNERDKREQKLDFMERNYQTLEQQVKQMRFMLLELRKKYKNASKEIFQLQSAHQKEREAIEEQFQTLRKENIVYRSVLGVLFTDRQLRNIVNLGRWQDQTSFHLPAFYFKDRHTLAFPCQEDIQSMSSTPIPPPTSQTVHHPSLSVDQGPPLAYTSHTSHLSQGAHQSHGSRSPHRLSRNSPMGSTTSGFGHHMGSQNGHLGQGGQTNSQQGSNCRTSHQARYNSKNKKLVRN